MSNRDIRATTVPLNVHEGTKLAKTIDSRMEMARQLYNIFIHEGRKRLERLKNNNKWDKVEAMWEVIKQTHKKSPKRDWYYKIRNELLYHHGLTGAKCFDSRFNGTPSLNAQFTPTWINEYIPGGLRSRIVRDASQRWHEAMHPTKDRPFRGLPKCRDKGDWDVLMGRDGYRKKDNTFGAGVRFSPNTSSIIVDSKSGDNDIVIPVDLTDERAKHAFNVIDGVPHPHKGDVYWIKRQMVRGKKRYFLVVMHQNGPFSSKYVTPVTKGVVGIDIGATFHWIVGETIDANGNTQPYFECVKLGDSFSEDKPKALNRYRALLKRAQPGSKNYQKYERKISELKRKIVEERKNKQNHVINLILTRFTKVKTEDILCDDWNKSKAFGGQVKKSSPGKFWRRLDYTCRTNNIPLEAHNCRQTRLSRQCACGHDYFENNLEERTKRCPACGLVMHRDILAAILILHTYNNATDFRKAQEFIKLYCNQLAEFWFKAIKQYPSAGTVKDVQDFCKIYGLNINDAGICRAVNGIS